ncbi:hypothetical protein HD554DRAFT_2174302 [Boletus coccyginus]|nr:hypothetical protein HD554DRAFT_2174302 [Boletus coccyginus]
MDESENYYLGAPFKNPDLEVDGMIQCRGRGSQQTYTASTPKNTDYAEKWESPDTMPPPESSSPVCLDADSSPFLTDLTRMLGREGPTVDRLLLCSPRDDGQSRVKAPAYPNAPTFPTTMSIGCLLPLPMDMSESCSPILSCSAAQGPLGGCLSAINKPQVVAVARDICVETVRTAIEQMDDLEKPDENDRVSAPGSLVPAFRKGALFSGPTILDLGISTELEPPSRDAENDRPDDAVPSKMPPRRVSIISVSFPAWATLDNSLKRRRSSVDYPPEPKKVKLDRTVSHVSCASDLSVQSKYQATEPASIRRAQSLKGYTPMRIYASFSPKDSNFYPSPLSSLTSRPCLDKDFPPTLPNTPLPNSVDYARSKANPLVRTLVVYRHRSLDIPAIPPVPIIAPPPHIRPTVICCAEDQAIDRLKALLLRERSERERDGLHVHDEKRAERLKLTCPSELAFSRRDSASTTDSSDYYSQWEEESTISAIESQESQELAASVKILPAQHRLANRETWSNAFGIANDFRKEITGWILEKLPKESVPCEKPSRDGRHHLYDQLVNSRQTRFHAAQLFHRYFLLPQKVKYWEEACKHERFEQESLESHSDSDCERGIWNLAVACMALSVKLHRDCLAPLGPIFAAGFLDMAPHAMSHDTFELAQRQVLYTFQFQLGSCTPQDVLDELWNALSTLRRASAPIGWTAVQCVTWDKLFQLLLEPDALQYPVTLLTAAALVDSLAFALACHYRTEGEANICTCKALARTQSSESMPDDSGPTSWQIHLYEASQLVDDVILDVRDVLHLSAIELDECRKWLSHVGQE